MSQTYAPSLADLADSPIRTGSWWAAVARALDVTDESLRQDTESLAPSVQEPGSEHPELIAPATRIAREGVRIRARVGRLRATVRRVAGDRSFGTAVASELATVARDVERYRRRSRWVTWESANRDLGGE